MVDLKDEEVLRQIWLVAFTEEMLLGVRQGHPTQGWLEVGHAKRVANQVVDRVRRGVSEREEKS